MGFYNKPEYPNTNPGIQPTIYQLQQLIQDHFSEFKFYFHKKLMVTDRITILGHPNPKINTQ
jgi:hypothetical protein